MQREIAGIKYVIDTTGVQQGLFLTQNQEENIDGIPVRPIWKWCLEK